MTWPLSLFVGFLTSVFTCIGAGLIADLCVGWYRISSREGNSAFFTLFIGLLGLVVGLIVGVICARVVAGSPSPGFLKALGVALGTMAGVLGISLGLCRLAADPAPTIDGNKLHLAVELRTPKGYAMPAAFDSIETSASVSSPAAASQYCGYFRREDATQVDGQWVIPAEVPLLTQTSNKRIEVQFNGQHFSIALPLPSRPTKKDLALSPWIAADVNPGQSAPAKEKTFFLRYQLQIPPPPPPMPSEAETTAKRIAEEEAVFKAVPDDAPISAWMVYTQYDTPPERVAIAVKKITARPNYIEELSVLMQSPDLDVATRALYLVNKFTPPSAALIKPVTAVGHQIVEAIRAFNATTPAQDPHYQVAADISVRFSAWMEAIRGLHAVDSTAFTPELQEILLIARVRKDSESMRRDIVRVASYYLHEWAGVAPLPTDPKPSGD